MNALLAQYNPFSSELAPAMVNPESITAPDLTDRSVAVVGNSVSDGAIFCSLPRENPVRIGESMPSVTLAGAPSDFNSVVTNTDTALNLEETPVLVLGAVTNSSSCGGGESRRPARYADQPGKSLSERTCETVCAPPTEAGAGVASRPHDSIPEPTPTPLPGVETAAGLMVPPSSPAAFFSLDVRIHTRRFEKLANYCVGVLIGSALVLVPYLLGVPLGVIALSCGILILVFVAALEFLRSRT